MTQTLSSPSNAQTSATPYTVVPPASQVEGSNTKIAPISLDELIARGRCARDASTKEQFKAILANLNVRLPQETQANLRSQFDSTLDYLKQRLNTLWQTDKAKLEEGRLTRSYSFRPSLKKYRYGSSWIQDNLSPLETNVHLIYTYPPIPHPDWKDPSPTMERMRAAGIDAIRKLSNCSWLHLHNHSHITETRSTERRDKPNTSGEGGQTSKQLYRMWPLDSAELCHELEFQATYVIMQRMKQHRPYAMVCFGEYGRDWFETYHDNRKFQKALGYEYRLEDIIWKISERPDRYLEAKLFRPVDNNAKATVVAVFPSSGAFVAHHINDDNDCIGKGLRLDACLEILRCCFRVKATMDTKTLFARWVQTCLEEQGRVQSYSFNLLHS